MALHQLTSRILLNNTSYPLHAISPHFFSETLHPASSSFRRARIHPTNNIAKGSYTHMYKATRDIVRTAGQTRASGERLRHITHAISNRRLEHGQLFPAARPRVNVRRRFRPDDSSPRRSPTIYYVVSVPFRAR